jgi:ketosteroid isomerase-like protein
MNYVLVFHIDDGKITEDWEVWTDQTALDEAWS